MDTIARSKWVWRSALMPIAVLVILGCAVDADESSSVGGFSEGLTLSDCRSDALECADNASTIREVMSCRDTFNECVESIELPDLASAVECARQAGSCLRDGGAIADCNTDFNDCLTNLYPDMGLGELPQIPETPQVPVSPEIPEGQEVIDCAQAAQDCVLDGKSTEECRSAFQECLASVIQEAPEVPQIPDQGDLPSPENFPAFGDLPDLGDLPDPGNFPAFGDPPDLGDLPQRPDPESVLDCLSSAMECFNEVENVSDCRDSFESCLSSYTPEQPETEIPSDQETPSFPEEVQSALDCVDMAGQCVEGNSEGADCRADFITCIEEVASQEGE